MIFAFIDESGHPHPNDSSDRPTLAAVCVDANRLRALNTEIFRLKRGLLGKDQFEIEAKAQKLLNRATFRRHPEKREFVESFFEMCGNFPMTVFAIVMEKPHAPPTADRDFLPMQFRYIIQSIDRFVELNANTDLAAVMFDGDGSQLNRISERFSNWLFRSAAGRSLTRIAETPFFVDSRFTPQIQVADMIAGAIRIYQENRLHRGVPPGDPFLSAVSRYYRIIQRKTVDIPAPGSDAELWHGIYFMSERRHHTRDERIQNENDSEAN